MTEQEYTDLEALISLRHISRILIDISEETSFVKEEQVKRIRSMVSGMIFQGSQKFDIDEEF